MDTKHNINNHRQKSLTHDIIIVEHQTQIYQIPYKTQSATITPNHDNSNINNNRQSRTIICLF